MSGVNEQLERNSSPARDGPKRRKFAKQRMNRAERREGKKLMEDAPKKRQYKGYTG